MSSDRPLPATARPVALGFRVLAVITYVLLVFGATVRVHGAGLACPDWPLCFGEVIPQLDFQIFLEWGHRALAGSVSLGFVGLSILALRDPAMRARVGWVIAAAVAVLAIQIVLGGLTVLHLLAYWSVTLHLLAGNLFFALLLGISIRLSPAPTPTPVSPAARGLLFATTAMWVVQMALGGLVSSNYAGLACTEWPTCNGGVWFPALDGIIGLQIFHRLGAYTLTALAIALRVVANGDAALRPAANLALGLVLVQVGVGITNVLLAMPVELAIAHSAVGAAIGASLVWAVWAILPRPVAARASSAIAAPAVAPEGA